MVGHEAEVHWPSYSRIVDFELEIGAVIGRGGCGNDLACILKHGDVVELSVGGIGVLRNRIVAPHVREVPTLPLRIL